MNIEKAIVNSMTSNLFWQRLLAAVVTAALLTHLGADLLISVPARRQHHRRQLRPLPHLKKPPIRLLTRPKNMTRPR